MTSELVKEYLQKFPDLPSLTLAKKIYADHWDKFKDVESVRGVIRIYRGSSGNWSRRGIKDTRFYDQKPVYKYNIPDGDTRAFEPYYLPKANNNILILGDMHFPYHDRVAIETSLDWGVKKGINTILLNGDILDFYQLSKFIKDPSTRRIKDEIAMLRLFLEGLKKDLPGVKIYYKMGNHEERFENYMKVKAPELFDISDFKLDVILHLAEYGVEYIGDKRKVMAGKLPILHGHEIRTSSSVNPARGIYLKIKKSAIANHYHQSSEHSETNFDGELSTVFSLGCLCDLHPEYAPYNNWNHGFAHAKINDDGTYRMFNARMCNYVVL